LGDGIGDTLVSNARDFFSPGSSGWTGRAMRDGRRYHGPIAQHLVFWLNGSWIPLQSAFWLVLLFVAARCP
jgi:hypothetical protein